MAGIVVNIPNQVPNIIILYAIWWMIESPGSLPPKKLRATQTPMAKKIIQETPTHRANCQSRFFLDRLGSTKLSLIDNLRMPYPMAKIGEIAKSQLNTNPKMSKIIWLPPYPQLRIGYSNRGRRLVASYFMLGKLRSAPARMLVGHRAVIVLSLVKNRTPSGPCM